MERCTKLVGGYLGLCCVFMAFLSVSSLNFYNPSEYMEKIDSLLTELKHDLKHMHIAHLKVEGVKYYELEREENCAANFLDIFQRGTKFISNLVLPHSIIHITDSIDHCVNKLRMDCRNIQKHDPKCNAAGHREGVIHFVEGFLNFTLLLRQWNTCKVDHNQGYEFSDDYNPDHSVSICGKY